MTTTEEAAILLRQRINDRLKAHKIAEQSHYVLLSLMDDDEPDATVELLESLCDAATSLRDAINERPDLPLDFGDVTDPYDHD